MYFTLQSPPSPYYSSYMEEFLIRFFSVSLCFQSNLAPNAESVEAKVSYNKISGWRSQGKYVRGSVERSLSSFNLLRKWLASFCLLTVK